NRRSERFVTTVTFPAAAKNRPSVSFSPVGEFSTEAKNRPSERFTTTVVFPAVAKKRPSERFGPIGPFLETDKNRPSERFTPVGVFGINSESRIDVTPFKCFGGALSSDVCGESVVIAQAPSRRRDLLLAEARFGHPGMRREFAGKHAGVDVGRS